MWYNNNSSTEISRKFYEKYNWIKEVTREIINEFVKKLPNSNENLFEKELAKLIDTLLISHVVFEDRKIINWLKSNHN